MNKRAPRLFAIVAAAACLFGIIIATPLMAPTAHADTLPNGYSVTCTPNGQQVICNISGCPRVHADEAGDVVHVKVNGGPQDEIAKGCNSATTTTVPGAANTTDTISVQGCRKHPVGSDDCGAWSDYKYTPPAPAAPNAPPSKQSGNLTFEVTGSGQVYGIVTDPATAAVGEGATAPWTRTITDPGDSLYQLVVTTKTGTQGCRITLNGKVVAEQPIGNSPHCIYKP